MCIDTRFALVIGRCSLVAIRILGHYDSGLVLVFVPSFSLSFLASRSFDLSLFRSLSLSFSSPWIGTISKVKGFGH